MWDRNRQCGEKVPKFLRRNIIRDVLIFFFYEVGDGRVQSVNICLGNFGMSITEVLIGLIVCFSGCVHDAFAL